MIDWRFFLSLMGDEITTHRECVKSLQSVKLF
jgi:hypothetical protein